MPHWCAEVRWVSGYLHPRTRQVIFFFLNKECGLKKRETFRDAWSQHSTEPCTKQRFAANNPSV